jgi:hypothetical protein
MGCGAAFLDYDNDGWLDIIVLTGLRLPPDGAIIRLYRNNRDGTFTDVTQKSGLGRHSVWATGITVGDYDNDGFDDVFVTCWGKNFLFHNNGNGTFSDVSEKAGLILPGARYGTGCTWIDYDRDGQLDLFVAHYVDFDPGKVPIRGKDPGCNYNGVPVFCGPSGLQQDPCSLYHNNGDGTFTDVSEKSGVAGSGKRWNTGCAFVDYDRDGHLDLFVANYIDLDLATAPVPESGPCLYKGVMVACGPPGLNGGKNILYHNNGDGTFSDVSEPAGLLQANGTYGLGVLTADFDNDGWPDIYVANDSTASALYQNKHNGKFVDIGMESGCSLSADGKPQAGMGVSAGDYDLDGNLDIVKTNFAGDTPSLYHNLGGSTFEDTTFAAGLGRHTQFLGWGCGFFDMDNDGWLDILICNGHVYPEVEQLKTEAGYPQQKLLYKNLRNGKFEDVSQQAGPGITVPVASRGCAFGDYDNDGDIDVVVNTVNDFPQLLRCDSPAGSNGTGHNWLKVRTIGTKSNRSGIGARLRCVTQSPDESKPHSQIDEVRSGGSYISQNDLRVHFGIGKAEKVDLLEIRWPSGQVDTLKDIKPNQLVFVREGQGIVRTVQFDRRQAKSGK